MNIRPQLSIRPSVLVFLMIIIIFHPALSLSSAEQSDAESQIKAINPFSSDSCSEMEIWEIAMGMCMPLPMTAMPMTMAMLRGNAFAVGITESGPRGQSALAAPNMFMADLGTSVGAWQYVNLDYMGTFERWTYPYSGYPELLQIGEENSQGVPFIDAQHPHSSPVMGLTLSDTIRFQDDAKDSVKIFFAPRGESTDGPIAFMHRITGIVNPDAPLGHHIGQDVGHISSTVIGASLLLASIRVELSTFNGTEPSPDAVDLPLGTPNSFAGRLIKEFSSQMTAMASVAYVQNPEASDPDIQSLYRYSASLYHHLSLNNWLLHNSLIYGLITNLDHASTLSSFAEEFLLQKKRDRWWGRIETLQRTAGELQISNFQDQNIGRWVEALTLGYSHSVASWRDSELSLGSSVTLDFLPSDIGLVYGSTVPIAAKIFLQYGGMKMWEL